MKLEALTRPQRLVEKWEASEGDEANQEHAATYRRMSEKIIIQLLRWQPR